MIFCNSLLNILVTHERKRTENGGENERKIKEGTRRARMWVR